MGQMNGRTGNPSQMLDEIAANAEIHKCAFLRSRLQDNGRRLVSIRIKSMLSWTVVDSELSLPSHYYRYC